MMDVKVAENPPRNPLVSVVIIFLDAELFLAEAVESVLSQSYPHWELWLVDDGSTDGSTEVARVYSRKDPERIRYLEHLGHANRGMSASRNLGLAATRGDFVALLDADDVWTPDKLERQVRLLSLHPEAGMLYGPGRYWYSWSREPRSEDFVQDLEVPTERLYPPLALIPRWLQSPGCTPGTCGTLLRRNALERIGGFEESFSGMYEDQVFFCKVAAELPVLVSSECWYLYRQHPGSCCARSFKNGSHFRARTMFLTWLRRRLQQRGIASPEVMGAIRRELRATESHRGALGFLRRVLWASVPTRARLWLRARGNLMFRSIS